MSKELKYISPGEQNDELSTVIGDFKAVVELNGHIPDDTETREELTAAGIEPTAHTIAAVRAANENK